MRSTSYRPEIFHFFFFFFFFDIADSEILHGRVTEATTVAKGRSEHRGVPRTAAERNKSSENKQTTWETRVAKWNKVTRVDVLAKSPALKAAS